MKYILQKILAPVLFFLLIPMTYAGAPMSGSLAPMLQKALPAVVNIRAQINPMLARQNNKNNKNDDNDAGPPNKLLSVASGVIVDANRGYILTNAHVIDDAQNVTITLSDGRHYTAKVIGLDKPSDIAVLQIQAKNLTAIPIADSSKLKVGDIVAAIGNPFGLNQSVSSGIVSALGRTTLGIENYENFIQTDAPINPGNSGGAMINTDGQLVGINTAILAPDRGSIGIGFAIPSNMAKSIMLQLIQFGNVRRGALGIAAQDITPELAVAFNLALSKGAAVAMVVPNSPAQKAGLQVGDIITSVNGSEVSNANDVVNAIGFLRVDSKATLQLLRNNKPLTLTADITDPNKRKQLSAASDPFFYGVALKDFTVLSPIHGDVKGILVVSVDEDSNAWHSDLMQGDVITSANQQPVTSITELKKIAAGSSHSLLLNVLRGSGAVFLVLNKEQ
jgi:serine protease Do